MNKIKHYQSKIQSVIDSGISHAQSREETLASKSFSYAEKLETSLRGYSIKQLHDQYANQSDKVFNGLRVLNDRAGSLVDSLVNRIEKETAYVKTLVDLPEGTHDVSEIK